MDSIYQPKNDERWSPSTYWAPSWSTNQPPTNHHRWIFRWRDIPPGACISSALANMSVASDRVCNNLELRSSTSWRFSWVVSGFQGRVVKDVKDGVGVYVLWKYTYVWYIDRYIYIYMCVILTGVCIYIYMYVCDMCMYCIIRRLGFTHAWQISSLGMWIHTCIYYTCSTLFQPAHW